MAYATVCQLQPRLFMGNQPTQADIEAMQVVLDAAAAAIDWEIPFNTTNPAPATFPDGLMALMVETNIARAVELWREQVTGFGIIPIADVGPVVTGRDA